MSKKVPHAPKQPLSHRTNADENGAAGLKPQNRLRAGLKFVPLALIGALVIVFFALGPDRFLNFDEVALGYAELNETVAAQPLIAAAAAIALYTLVTSVSFPAAWLVTVVYGLVFGWALATSYVVVGATLGAGILYLVTRIALAEFFKKRAGKRLNKMAQGFKRDAWSYMLFLRLAPIFPFTLVNVVPAILGVPFRIFIITTALGIVPGTFAFAYAGEGLRSIVARRAEACMDGLPPCGTPLAPSDLVTPQTVFAFAVLGFVSLAPVLVRRLRKNGIDQANGDAQ